MRTKTVLFMVVALLAATSGWVQADEVTSAKAEKYAGSYYSNARFEVKPMLGMVNFIDARRDRDARASIGVTGLYNVMKDAGGDSSLWLAGPETGVVYSHLGDPGSGFFGAGSTNTAAGHSGANVLMIPANLKVGYNVINDLRVALHGGANIFYRNEVAAMVLTDSDTSDKNWTALPNVGAEFQYAVSRNAAVALRPDWTIATNRNVISAMLSVGVAL